MSTFLAIAVILYLVGCIGSFIFAAITMWDGKDDLSRWERRKYSWVEEDDIADARRRVQLGLSIIRGGFLAWPKLLARGVARSIRDAERYTK